VKLPVQSQKNAPRRATESSHESNNWLSRSANFQRQYACIFSLRCVFTFIISSCNLQH